MQSLPILSVARVKRSPTWRDRPLVIRMGSREGIIYRISPESIWIGHAGEGHDFTPLLDLGIEAMIELAEEAPSFPTRRDLISCRFPLIDGVGNRPELLALAIRTVAILIAAGIPTLVCCSDGLSRAPAIIAAALALVHREPKADCLKRIARHHPGDVLTGFWREVTGLPPEAFEVGRAPR